MSIIENVSKTIEKLSPTTIEERRAFSKMPFSIDIKILKGKRKVKRCILDSTQSTLRFYKVDCDVCCHDYLVDERNNRYVASEVIDDDHFSLLINGVTREIKTVVVSFQRPHGTKSLLEKADNASNSSQNIVININNAQNSQFGDIGKQLIDITKNMSIGECWEGLKEDLSWRYDGELYSKMTTDVSKAIASKTLEDSTKKELDNAARRIGSFLGELLSSFVINLIEYCKKQ